MQCDNFSVRTQNTPRFHTWTSYSGTRVGVVLPAVLRKQKVCMIKQFPPPSQLTSGALQAKTGLIHR